MPEAWVSGGDYEPYIGRWSRLVAAQFLDWLSVPSAARWLDVGCGTGALTAAILARCDPAQVIAVDPAEDYVSWAGRHISGRVRFMAGDAAHLPDDLFDAVVSGLVLNFVPDVGAAIQSMCRRASRDGVVAAYVWDDAGRMELIRYFWDAAVALDPDAAALDEGLRFPVCHPDRLEALWRAAALEGVSSRAIDIRTVFGSFDDYWQPFLGGQGPAPGYCMSLDQTRRDALRELIRQRLRVAPDGSIRLIARAWAIRGSSRRGPGA